MVLNKSLDISGPLILDLSFINAITIAYATRKDATRTVSWDVMRLESSSVL